MKHKSLPEEVKISEEVLFQEIEGESVLLNMATEKYFGLDEIGTRIWHLLSEDSKPLNALDNLQKEYNVDAEILHKDLFGLILELNERGLVSIEK